MILFIRIPKNASTSLYESFGRNNLIKNREEVLLKKLSALSWWQRFAHPSHINLEIAVNLLGKEIIDLPRVCCVRNPFDKMVSAFEFSKKMEVWRVFSDTEPTFPEFTEYYCRRVNDKDFIHGNTQTKWMSLNGKIAIENIFKFENLKKDFEIFCSDYGLNCKLNHLNSTEHRDYSLYYDNRLKNLVYSAYREDFDNFNYEF